MQSTNDIISKLINKHGKSQLLSMIINFGEDEKLCPICKKNLQAEFFYVRPSGHLSSYCKQCAKEYNKKHYKKRDRFKRR